MAHLSGAVCAEHVEMRTLAESFGYGSGNLNAATDSDEINILGVTLKKQIAHISSDDVAFARGSVGNLPYGTEYRQCQPVGEIHCANCIISTGALVSDCIPADVMT